MTSTVGIRLEAAMQAWPLQRRGRRRDSHTRPTKSGVVGLVANALGRDFADPIDDLAALRFGVRVDRAGSLETDFHTTGGGQMFALPSEIVHFDKVSDRIGDPKGDPAEPNWLKYRPMEAVTKPSAGWNLNATRGPKGEGGKVYLTTDLYLADASFLAALEGPDDLIDEIADALAAPARAVFLGRKAYGPATPLLELTVEGPLEELFEVAPTAHDGGASDAYLEPQPGQHGTVVHDQPVSFDGPIRRAARLERHYTVTVARWHTDTADENLFDSVFTEKA